MQIMYSFQCIAALMCVVSTVYAFKSSSVISSTSEPSIQTLKDKLKALDKHLLYVIACASPSYKYRLPGSTEDVHFSSCKPYYSSCDHLSGTQFEIFLYDQLITLCKQECYYRYLEKDLKEFKLRLEEECPSVGFIEFYKRYWASGGDRRVYRVSHHGETLRSEESFCSSLILAESFYQVSFHCVFSLFL